MSLITMSLIIQSFKLFFSNLEPFTVFLLALSFVLFTVTILRK